MQMTLTDTLTTITLPAYAGSTLGETLTVTVPADVAELVADLAPALCYGPEFRRWVVSSLRDASHAAEAGYVELARERVTKARDRYIGEAGSASPLLLLALVPVALVVTFVASLFGAVAGAF